MIRGYINAQGQTITVPERGVTKVATKADQAPLPNDYASAEAPLPQLLYPPSQGEVAALVARLEAADIDPGNGVKAAQAAADTIEQHCAVAPGGRRFEMVLTNLTEDDLLAELREAAADVLAHDELRLQGAKFVDQVAVEAAGILAIESDRITKAMRADFDEAVKVVQAAAAAGLTPTTTAEQVIELGADVLGAFQTLPAAVAVLDELAGIRDELTTLAGVGPRDYPAAAWLANAATKLDLVGALSLAKGSTEYAQQEGVPFGAYMSKVPVRRVGGAWLALVCAGYALRLNTGAEADALVANAKRTP
jgi:hypothetical protein